MRQLIGAPPDDDRGNVSIGTVNDPQLANYETPAVPELHGRLVVIRTVLVLAVAIGIALRLWYLFHDTLNADEASVGLAAQNISHGHFSAFYPGQLYGGVEPYVVAVLFKVFGQSAFMLKLAPALLSGVAALIMWRVVLRLVGDRQVAALAGALLWVAPMVGIWNSTVERGFRGITMACGLACVLFALRCLDGRHGYADLAALGLFLGLGWWSSPEIVYFAVPTGLLLIGAVAVSLTGHRIRTWVPRFAAGVAAAAVGALPWLWVNIPGLGFPSLKSSSFAGGSAMQNPGYGGRLQIFVSHVLPMQTNVAAPGTDLFHGPLQLAFQVGFDAVLVVALVLCVLKGGRGLAIAAGALALPFLYALQPGTWFWLDNRYAVFVGAWLVLLVAIGCDEAPLLLARFDQQHQPHRHGHIGASTTARYLMCGVVVVSSVFTVMLFGKAGPPFAKGNSNFFSDWGDPNAATLQAINRLESAGVRTGYADYWVAYDLDFLSKGTFTIDVLPGADVDRSVPIDHIVEASPHPAWLFVPPEQMREGYHLFGAIASIVGPGTFTEKEFTAKLAALGVSYRVVDVGLFRAVIPARNVTPAEIGLP